MSRIDLNCDMGESFGAYTMGNDIAILDFVNSANIACGFHAGDPPTIHKTVEAALRKGVAVGAHPGFPDLQGFGRRSMAVSAGEAYDMVIYQIGAVAAFAPTRYAFTVTSPTPWRSPNGSGRSLNVSASRSRRCPRRSGYR